MSYEDRFEVGHAYYRDFGIVGVITKIENGIATLDAGGSLIADPCLLRCERQFIAANHNSLGILYMETKRPEVYSEVDYKGVKYTVKRESTRNAYVLGDGESRPLLLERSDYLFSDAELVSMVLKDNYCEPERRNVRLSVIQNFPETPTDGDIHSAMTVLGIYADFFGSLFTEARKEYDVLRLGNADISRLDESRIAVVKLIKKAKPRADFFTLSIKGPYVRQSH